MALTGTRSIRRTALVAVLVLCISAVFFAPDVLAVTPEKVTSDHDADWHMRRTACEGTPDGDQSFVTGPVGPFLGDSDSLEPPAGSGSLRFTIGDNGNSLEENRNTRYSGRLVSDIVELTYWTYVSTSPTPGDVPAVYLGLSVDTNNDNVFDDDLVFEPGYQQTTDGHGDSQHAISTGRWQQWTAKDVGTEGNEGRWYRRSQPTIFNSLEGWSQQISGLRIVNPATLAGVSDPDRNGSLFLAAGCGDGTWDDFVGYADDLSLTINIAPASSLDYDFDPPQTGSATRLACVPETDLNPVGQSHVATCTATNDAGQRVSGVNIDLEFLGANDSNGDTPRDPDYTCETRMDNPTTPTTNEAGTCTFTHPGSAARNRGVTTYIAWIDDDGSNITTEADLNEGQNEAADPGPRPEPDDTEVVSKEWAPLLDCSPETPTLQPNSANTITCTVRDSVANLPNVNVDIEISGPNDTEAISPPSYQSPDLTCTTNEVGSCSVVHGPGGKGSTSSTGVTTYRAWVDLDGSDTTFELDQNEGRAESSSPGLVAEADYTDVVQATWSTTAPTPSPTASVTPTPTPSVTPTPTPTPTTSVSPSPSPTPTAGPHGCAGDPDALTGTPGDDVLRGTPGDDTICGFGGNDKLIGRGGNDKLLGGAGDDILRGGPGSDTLKGRKGKDVVRGGRGPDQLFGNGGADLLSGGRGHDRLDGGRGKDTCAGGEGRDRLVRCE